MFVLFSFLCKIRTFCESWIKFVVFQTDFDDNVSELLGRFRICHQIAPIFQEFSNLDGPCRQNNFEVSTDFHGPGGTRSKITVQGA